MRPVRSRIFRTALRSFAAALAVHTLPLAAATLVQGPLLGAATPTGVRLVARWDQAGATALELRAAGERTFRRAATGEATAAGDGTGRFAVDGLAPDTLYEYRLVLETGPGPSGRSVSPSHWFRTLPAVPEQLRFAVLADFASKLKASPALRAATSPRPDFIAVLGDWDHRNPANDADTRRIAPPEQAAQVLENMRRMHRETRDPATPIGADLHAAVIASSAERPQVPLVYAWDDHDFCANNADSTCPFADAARQAYAEYYAPADDNGLAGHGGCGERGDWQSFRAGDIASVFVLDARSQRIGGTTLLGRCQLQWLLAGLRASTAAWKLVLSPVTFNPGTKPWDAWAGFAAERQRIVDTVAAEGIRGVVVISGDIHSGGAIDDGRHSGLPEVSVPHANMPKSMANTYCRATRDGAGRTLLTSAPGSWTIGSLENPHVPSGRCLGRTYNAFEAAPLPAPPYPLDGLDAPGYLLVEASPSLLRLEVFAADGTLKAGRLADGRQVPMRLDLAAAPPVPSALR